MAKTGHMAGRAALLALVLAQAAAAQPGAGDVAALPDDLTLLPLEELLNIQVTSVSRVAEDLSGAPAAIDVITAAEIERSGARNLPELLRMVTGLQVAQINGRSWAIASRGFNASTSDKLEVRLDGRSLYTPLFSGVIWEIQDPPLETIERIEVIRGPGASLWGANAMNGVINIISKSARDTTGSRLAARSGSELRRQIYARQGEDLGRYGHWRAYAQTRERGATTLDDFRDAHEISSAGLRGDLDLGAEDELLLSLNTQDARMGSGSTPPGVDETLRAADLIARWTRQLGQDADLQLQLSLDRQWRHIPGFFGEDRRQVDLDLRHHWSRGRHDLVWGFGYRRSSDRISNSPTLFFDPAETELDIYNLFAQDRISLGRALTLTLGSKFEHNDFTGLEIQPSLRLSWDQRSGSTLWLAASRAARSPNRVDRHLGTTTPPPIQTNDEFAAEEALIGEAGWRRRFGRALSLNLAGFYADYEELRGVTLTEQNTLVVANNGRGRSLGLELDLLWQPQDRLQLHFGYAWLDLDFAAYPDRMDVNIDGANENDPEHQFKLLGHWSASDRLQLHGLLRHVDELRDRRTPAYTELDLRLGYSIRPGLELELAGRNLLDDAHAEFDSPDGAQIEREIYGGFRWELR